MVFNMLKDMEFVRKHVKSIAYHLVNWASCNSRILLCSTYLPSAISDKVVSHPFIFVRRSRKSPRCLRTSIRPWLSKFWTQFGIEPQAGRVIAYLVQNYCCVCVKNRFRCYQLTHLPFCWAKEAKTLHLLKVLLCCTTQRLLCFVQIGKYFVRSRIAMVDSNMLGIFHSSCVAETLYPVLFGYLVHRCTETPSFTHLRSAYAPSISPLNMLSTAKRLTAC